MEYSIKDKTITSQKSVSLEQVEQRMGYSNLKKFRNKIDNFNKKIKEVLPITKKNKTFELPEVNFSEDGESRYLHLGTPWIQGAMNIKVPFELELEYVQRMMAGLLFLKSASVSGRHAMQLGLGAASLTKFCRKKLQMKTTVLEINPQVLNACRTWFKLPVY